MQKVISCFVLLVSLVSSAAAEISENQSILFSLQRHTYVEGEKSISLGMRNSDSEPYLIQAGMAWLDEASGVNLLQKDEKIPFIITPPLYKLEPGSYYDWRVIFSGNSANLPRDREKVYLARFLAVSPSDAGKNNIDISVMRALIFKIYYRPQALKSLQIADIQDRLEFRMSDGYLVIKNNSPLYLTFDTISVGKSIVAESELFKPLPPFSEQIFEISGDISAEADVAWALLDEYSFSLDVKYSKLN